MVYSWRKLNWSDAVAITQWRYEAPYSVYDMICNPAELVNEEYYSCVDGEGDIVGFGCFGFEAQVHGGILIGAYADTSIVDIGLGFRPDLTGKGQGMSFLQSLLEFAEHKFHPKGFRLTVASWNTRAICLYGKGGFSPVRTFASMTLVGETQFILMERGPLCPRQGSLT